MNGTATSTRGTGLVAVMRWVFGIFFIAFGILHFVVPDGLPTPMAWMYDLDTPLHIVAGTAEILGGLGLILPRLTGVMPRLTALAAAGLTTVMVGAAAWHLTRSEWTSIVMNLVVAAAMAYVAIHEWRSTAS